MNMAFQKLYVSYNDLLKKPDPGRPHWSVAIDSCLIVKK